jgi:hypothetical protein
MRKVEKPNGNTHSGLISRNRRARINVEKIDRVGQYAARDSKREYDAPKHLDDGSCDHCPVRAREDVKNTVVVEVMKRSEGEEEMKSTSP